MDWKEGAKWIVILVGAGLISAVIEIVIEDRLRGTVKATAKTEARAEVQRTIAEAVQQASVQQQQLRGSRVTTNVAQPTYTPQVSVDPRQQGFPINI